MRLIYRLFCCLLLLLFSNLNQAWAQHKPVNNKPVTKAPKRTQPADIPQVQYGIASFYDNKFEGRKTANGEVFSQKKMTAASNTLPLNSWVKVTNLSNKRSVYVRITDRMHHRNKRLIDLSRSAASSLGYTGKGLTRVKVEYMGRKKPGNEPREAPVPSSEK